MSEAILTASHLCVSLGGKEILHDVSLRVAKGDFLTLIGPNGSGKSTLLHTLCGLTKPGQGSVTLAGQPLAAYGRKELAQKIALVTQQHTLPADLTVYDLVRCGRFPYRHFPRGLGAEDREKIDQALFATSLTPYAQREVKSLSGGEQQRAWLATALAQEPEIMVLDEPTTYLDIRHQFMLLELLQEWHDRRGLTIVIVLHDLNQAYTWGQTTAVLAEGRIAAAGSTAEVITPELMQRVFGVTSEIVTTSSGRSFLACYPQTAPKR